jgi:predicted CXXCH cytochrome family protein
VGHSYFVRIGDYLFQSPVSYYSHTNAWDVTPGYEGKKRLDFTRQITSACLFCHTGAVALFAGTTNRFKNPPFTAISCERCHGDVRPHLLEPVPGSIINPAKLSGAERDSVCEQCHLEGVARILNPGRDWWDYRPGGLLEKTFVIYLENTSGAGLRAVSHSEQLALSRCARESGGRMWCGTCHNPHADKTDRAAQVRKICLSCHAPVFAASKHAPADECVTCHMPRLRPTDVAHSAITDHRIVRKPMPDDAPNRAPAELRAWRQPDTTIAARDLGMAYYALAADQPDPEKLKRAYELLSGLPPAARDPSALADLGSILLEQGQFPLSVDLFAQAARGDPANSRYAYCLGVAQERSGMLSAAIEALRRSIHLDPSQADAYLALARIYDEMGLQGQKEQVILQYLRFMPQNLALRSSD